MRQKIRILTEESPLVKQSSGVYIPEILRGTERPLATFALNGSPLIPEVTPPNPAPVNTGLPLPPFATTDGASLNVVAPTGSSQTVQSNGGTASSSEASSATAPTASSATAPQGAGIPLVQVPFAELGQLGHILEQRSQGNDSADSNSTATASPPANQAQPSANAPSSGAPSSAASIPEVTAPLNPTGPRVMAFNRGFELSSAPSTAPSDPAVNAANNSSDALPPLPSSNSQSASASADSAHSEAAQSSSSAQNAPSDAGVTKPDTSNPTGDSAGLTPTNSTTTVQPRSAAAGVLSAMSAVLNASVPLAKQALNATAVAVVNNTAALAASSVLLPMLTNLTNDTFAPRAALPSPSSLAASHRIVTLSDDPPRNQDNDHPADYHWAIGVVLAAIASVVSNLGLNFQKLTHLKIADQDEHAKRNYYKDTVWMLGLLMVILGSLADFAALAFGAQSIIAPLGSLTLVANVFFAPCLLGETLTKRDLLATLTIIIGATVSVMFASHKDTIYDLEELFSFYGMPRFGLYAIFIMLLLGVMWSATQYMEAIRKENPKAPQYYRLIKYHRFCYAALAGTIGAQSVLFAKCSAELIVNSFLGKGFFLSYYQAWMVLICMCLSIFLQIKWLNQGLQRFDALYIVPVFQSFWILISVLAGLVFFGEYAEMDDTQVAMFPVGIVLTVIGVYFLSLRGVDESTPPHLSKSSETSAVAADDNAGTEVQEKDGEHPDEDDEFDPRLDHEIEHAQDPLIKGKDSSSAPHPSPQPSVHTPHDPRRKLHQRVDSTVGFGGAGLPAGFLPTRAMTLGNSLRAENEHDPVPSVDDDDL